MVTLEGMPTSYERVLSPESTFLAQRVLYRVAAKVTGFERMAEYGCSLGESSVSNFAYAYLEKLGFRVKVKGLPLSLESDKRILYVGHHVSNLDMFILWDALGIPVKVMGFRYHWFANLNNITQESTVPVIPKAFAKGFLGQSRPIKIITIANNVPTRSIQEINEMNERAINFAIDILSKDGIFMIFPNGKLGGKRWFNGVGRIISGVGHRGIVDMRIIPFFISGISPLEIYRRVFSNFVLNRDVSTKTVGVEFGNPLYIDSSRSSREITADLKFKYDNWVSSL